MRVIVADSDRQVRSALRLILDQEPGIYEVCEAADSSSLFTTLQEAGPEVGLILLDWDLPGLMVGGPAGERLAQLKTQAPGVRIIAMSVRAGCRSAALAAGASGFASKSDPPERWLEMIRDFLQE